MKKLLIAIILLCSTATAQINHVFIFVGENETYQQVIGTAPYITSLAKEWTSYSNYYAITNPSQPNYLVFGAGTTFGITDDLNHGANSKNVPNLWGQLFAVKKTAEGYFEGLPNRGSLVFNYNLYDAKHNPFYMLGNVPDSVMRPFTDLTDPSKCANVVYIIPNEINNGHNGGILLNFDNWLKGSFAQKIINYCLVPSNHSIFIIKFDEGNSSSNRTAYVIAGAGVNKGLVVSTRYNHYSDFNTMLGLYGANSCNDAIGAIPMTEWIYQQKDTLPHDTICIKYILKDTTARFVKDSCIKVFWDSTFKVATAIRINCDSTSTPPTTNTDTAIQRWAYMRHADTKIGTSAKETVALNYAKQTGLTGFAPYNMTSVLSDGGARYKAFQIKCHANKIKLGAVYGSLNELNLIKNTIQPDFLLREKECWNEGSTVQSVSDDSTWAAQAEKTGIEQGNYIGWILPPTVNQYSSELVTQSDFLEIHCYRTKLDSDYVQVRLDQLYPVAKSRNKVIHAGTIESFESIYMGNGLTKFDEIHPYFEKLFKRYAPYIVYDRDIYFTDDLMMSVVPYKAPSVFRSIFPVNYVQKSVRSTTNDTQP